MAGWMAAAPDIATLLFLSAVALAAGLARGFSGFGAALIFVPLASAAIGPHVAVPLLLVVDGILTLGLIPGALRIGDRRGVLVMATGAVVGLPAGVFLLTALDPVVIRWSIVALVALLLALLMSGWRYRRRPRAPLTVMVGMASGVLSGVAQVGGPPVVAYWLGGTSSPSVVRANIVLYFAISSVLSAAGYVWAGLFTGAIVTGALCVAPAYAAGLYAGHRLFGLASEAVFRRVCYGMIAAAALLSMPALDGLFR